MHKGVFTSIDYPGASYTRALAINARGDITGLFGSADGTEHGFLLRDGQLTQIDPPGASQTNARGINNAGDITGIFVDAAGNESGFILRDGKLQKIRVPGSLTNDVYMAEDNGRVMVGVTVLQSDGASHGFARNASGHFDIIDVPGTNVPCTFAQRINESGDIVGYFANVDSVDECNNTPHVDGFLLRKGNYTVIKVPGAIDSGGLGINDDGVIVGFFLDKKGVHGFKAVPVN